MSTQKKKKRHPSLRPRPMTPLGDDDNEKSHPEINAIAIAYKKESEQAVSKKSFVEDIASFMGIERPNVYRLVRGDDINYQIKNIDLLCKYFDLNIFETLAGCEYPTGYINWYYNPDAYARHFDLPENTANAGLHIAKTPGRSIRLKTLAQLVNNYINPNKKSPEFTDNLIHIMIPASSAMWRKWERELFMRYELFGKRFRKFKFPDKKILEKDPTEMQDLSLSF